MLLRDGQVRSVAYALCGLLAHIEIVGNERVRKCTKVECMEVGTLQVMEGGIRALWRRLLAQNRAVIRVGAGRLLRWGWRAVSRYVQAWNGKGDLRG